MIYKIDLYGKVPDVASVFWRVPHRCPCSRPSRSHWWLFFWYMVQNRHQMYAMYRPSGTNDYLHFWTTEVISTLSVRETSQLEITSMCWIDLGLWAASNRKKVSKWLMQYRRLISEMQEVPSQGNWNIIALTTSATSLLSWLDFVLRAAKCLLNYQTMRIREQRSLSRPMTLARTGHMYSPEKNRVLKLVHIHDCS